MNRNRFTDRLRAHAGRPGTAPVRAEIPTTSIDEAGRVATLRLYDPIDSWGEWWGISAKELAQALDALPNRIEEIRLHINSPGGDVFDGIAIVNLLRQHPAKVVAIVDGIAASAASFIACAVDELLMAPNSELMIHDAYSLCVGNAAEMREMADLLDHISDNIASIYAAKAGGDVATWRLAMTTESWYSAEEAVAVGLADRVAEAEVADDEPAAKARHDLSVFTYAGRRAAPTPGATPAEIPEPPAPKTADPAANQDRARRLRLLVASTPGVAPLTAPAAS